MSAPWWGCAITTTWCANSMCRLSWAGLSPLTCWKRFTCSWRNLRKAVPRSKISTRARCSMKGTGRRRRPSRAYLKFPTGNGAASARFRRVACGSGRNMPLSMPKDCSTSQMFAPRSRGSASARRFCSASRNPPTVRHLERAARPKSHWARRWYLRKVRVPPTTNTGATSLHSESVSNNETKDLAAFSCPVRLPAGERILLGHGSGGKLSAELLKNVFLPALGNPVLNRLEDQAIVSLNGARLAITTDSFVVKPLIFRGGDIGSLAVHGTINDLAMGGAEPLWLSAAFILEEGLPIETLRRVVGSMHEAAANAGVEIVTGDTKVVEKGSADGIFINTTGIGLVREGITLSATQARPGDAILVSGMLGDHGIAILAEREGLQFETAVQSDSASLHTLVASLLEATREVRCLRDPTRGGL